MEKREHSREQQQHHQCKKREPVAVPVVGWGRGTIRQTFPVSAVTVRSAEPQGHLCPPCCSDL